MQPFAKDILIIDFESTGGDVDVDEPIQLGALLLDRATLEEKKSFLTLIQADYSKMKPEALDCHGITEDKLKNAPSRAEAAQKFVDSFGFDFILASWVQNLDHAMLKKLVAAIGVPMKKYDYHFFDLWPSAYLYLLQRGYTGTMRSEPMFQALGLPARDKHDALADCRMAADILRKITREN